MFVKFSVLHRFTRGWIIRKKYQAEATKKITAAKKSKSAAPPPPDQKKLVHQDSGMDIAPDRNKTDEKANTGSLNCVGNMWLVTI